MSRINQANASDIDPEGPFLSLDSDEDVYNEQ